MLKRTSLAILLAVAGCGDNSPSNFPPSLTVQAIEITVAQDGTAMIDATAHDPETAAVTYSASAPAHGVLTGTGPIYTYKPRADYVGSDALTITVSDGKNTLAVPVMITIVAADAVPVADAQTVSVDRNVAKAITLTGHDADDDDLIFEVATPPAHGTLSGEPPDLIYTPDHNYAGADSFTFDATDAAVSSAPATVTITVVAVPTCGDGIMEGTEECDDGNDYSDDGCNNFCVLPKCGDGVVQLDRGEECDDGNLVDGDGCDASCLSGAFETIAPIQISNELCTTETAALSHKVAVDGRGTIYAVMRCGGEAEAATVVVSTDRGAHYGTPIKLAADGEFDSHVAVAVGPIGTAYVGVVRDSGEVYLRVTHDSGATWEPAISLGTTSENGDGLSLVAFNDRVYVGFTSEVGMAVMRNHTHAVGPFASSSVVMDVSPIHLTFDPTSRFLLAGADSPDFHLRTSADDGVTFNPEGTPPGSEFFSDWSFSHGHLFISGTNLGHLGNATTLYVIQIATDSTPIVGLPVVTTASSRTVSADVKGNAFVGSQLDDNAGIQLDRLPLDADAFDPPRLINDAGDSPSVGPLPGQHGAAVIYTDGFTVWASVQSYDPLP